MGQGTGRMKTKSLTVRGVNYVICSTQQKLQQMKSHTHFHHFTLFFCCHRRWKSYNRKVIGRSILVGVLTGTKQVDWKHFHTLINMFKKTLSLPIPANGKKLTGIYLIESGTGRVKVKQIKGCHEIDIQAIKSNYSISRIILI